MRKWEGTSRYITGRGSQKSMETRPSFFGTLHAEHLHGVATDVGEQAASE